MIKLAIGGSKSVALALVCMALTEIAATAEPAPVESSPVGRVSSSRDADLLAAMLRADLFDDARSMCESRIAGSNGDSLHRARWTSNLVRVELNESLSRGTLSDSQLVEIGAPVSKLMAEYPESRATVFLQFQAIEILRAACFQDCVVASTRGVDSAATLRAIERSARLVSDSEALIAEVQRERIAMDKIGGTATRAMTKDLEELDQRLHIGVVQSMLAITEIFVIGSDDQRDAATKAMRYADASLESLSTGSAGWGEMQLLRIEAMLRSGSTRSAVEALESLAPLEASEAEIQRRALQVKVDLADQRFSAVENQLSAFYGNDPQSAPMSLDMDLARLSFLLQLQHITAQQASELVDVPQDINVAASRWIESIGMRNGAYARRRAEAIVLSDFRFARGNDAGQNGDVDPAIIAIEGEDWLRRGDPARAAELLAAAAIHDSDATRAIQRGSKAAAAYVAASDPAGAASILYRVAMRHTDHEAAPAMAVQAAMLLAQANDKNNDTQVETMLRETIATWPITGPVASARAWLIQALQRQQRYIDAAEVTTLNLNSPVDAGRLNEFAHSWRIALSQATTNELAALSERFEHATTDIDRRASESTYTAYLAAAAFALEREKLPNTNESQPPPVGELTIPLALVRFRQSLVLSEVLGPLESSWQADVERRLMRDAIIDASLREPIAKLIEAWPGVTTESSDHVSRLIWLDRVDEANAAAATLVATADQRGAVIRELAIAFGESENSTLQAAAVKWWDELSSGVTRGSDAWHEAKLRAAQLCDAAEAGKRAKYILLTQPPQDAGILRQYQALTRGRDR